MKETNLFSKMAELYERGKPFAQVIIIRAEGSTPRKTGTKMVITDRETFGSLGGGIVEAEIISVARKALRKGESILYRRTLRDDQKENGMICGGEMDVYIDVVKPKARLLIFGGGYVGREVAKLALNLGFSVMLFDDRDLREDLPDGIKFVRGDMVEAIESIDFGKEDYILITTRSHHLDQRILSKVIKFDVSYIGMVASKRKWKTIRDNLISEGFSEDALNKVRAPVGLEIGAETPEEIAVSILAEIIACRKGVLSVEGNQGSR